MPPTASSSSISLTISTARGPVKGQWRPSSVTHAGAILLSNSDNALAGPSDLFYDLAGRLQRNASVLHLEVGHGSLEDRLFTLLSALSALRRQGIERMALIGWGSGATLALAAAATSESVTGVTALAPSVAVADLIPDIAPRKLLLMHGSADSVAPASASRLLYARALEPRELIIYPGEGHDFSIYRDEVVDKLTAWTRSLLRSPFRPRRARVAEAALGTACETGETLITDSFASPAHS